VGSFGHLEEVGEVDKADRPNNLFKDLKRHRVKRHGMYLVFRSDDGKKIWKRSPISTADPPQNLRKFEINQRNKVPVKVS
jgi:hypothetical protein